MPKAPKILLIMSILLTQWIAACASTGKDDSQLTMSELSEKSAPKANVAFARFSGLSDYSHKETPLKVEWLGCKPSSGEKGTVLVMHRDKSGYDGLKFCEGWIAQTFLANGLAVIAVNRPGFGNSNGRSDFHGGKSMAAIKKGLQAALTAMKPVPPPSGVWGYSSGAPAALFASKSIENLQWAIVGGGIYDLDDTLQKSEDSYIKREIEDIKKLEGARGLEDRSIAYDVSGLPKRIIVYHGKDDKAVPMTQAVSFEETLNANEYQATMQLVEGSPHDIPAATHRQLLEVLLHSIMQ